VVRALRENLERKQNGIPAEKRLCACLTVNHLLGIMSRQLILPNGDTGLTFQGSPPLIQSVAIHSPFHEEHLEGLYVQSLIVPGCEISFIPHTTQLHHDLERFQHVSRILLLRDSPLNGPPVWKITLPTGKLGITMKGFPPVISSVDFDSSCREFIQVGMVVDRLIVPNICDMSLSSGGFTDIRVMKALHESENIEGRLLVICEPTLAPYVKKSQMFDLGSFKPSKGWSLSRMFK
jgi:hypothetical protein